MSRAPQRSIRDYANKMVDGDVVVIRSSIGHRVSLVKSNGIVSLITIVIDACGNEDVSSCMVAS